MRQFHSLVQYSVINIALVTSVTRQCIYTDLQRKILLLLVVVAVDLISFKIHSNNVKNWLSVCNKNLNSISFLLFWWDPGIVPARLGVGLTPGTPL